MEAEARAAALPCWRGVVTPQPLGGGITNTNFLVEDAGERFVVRIGDDIPHHGILRFNELAVARAAHAAGLSPEVVWHGPGALVMRFVEGRSLQPADVAGPAMLRRIVPLLRAFHRDLRRHLRGPLLMFWVFHVIHDYAATLREDGSRHAARLPELLAVAETLERAVGPIDLVFGHNDLLAANLIDDGARLWLLDFDYAGFNSPLFDLGGLASNNGLDEARQRLLLELYFGVPPEAGLWRRYQAMSCASLLREALWSMVSEIHSRLDFDYAGYTEENLRRFAAAYAAFQDLPEGGA